MAKLVLENLSRSFPGGVWAVRDLSLAVRDGELLALVGPSGSGKTTTLRMIAGLDPPTSGQVALDDKPLDGVPPWKRNVALVFQHDALCPHLTVKDNVLLAQKWTQKRADRVGKVDTREEWRIEAIARRLGIDSVLDRRPAELSGGQRRRASVVRALARRPAVLLLDEPLTGLDPALREQLRAELVGVQRELGVTTILVTHDQVQALAVGDRVAVMENGRIEQIDSPEVVYHRPANVTVARLIGEPAMNLWPGRVERSSGDWVWRRAGLRVPLPSPLGARLPINESGELVYGVRPEDVAIRDAAPPAGSPQDDGQVTVAAKLTRVEFRGDRTVVYGEVVDAETVQGETEEFGVAIAGNADPAASWTLGQRLTASWRRNRAHWFDGQSRIRLGSPTDQ
jgi:multiple sugar transport system ATP-binding protein